MLLLFGKAWIPRESGSGLTQEAPWTPRRF
jgi:hypothetical protein